MQNAVAVFGNFYSSQSCHDHETETTSCSEGKSEPFARTDEGRGSGVVGVSGLRTGFGQSWWLCSSSCG